MVNFLLMWLELYLLYSFKSTSSSWQPQLSDKRKLFLIFQHLNFFNTILLMARSGLPCTLKFLSSISWYVCYNIQIFLTFYNVFKEIFLSVIHSSFLLETNKKKKRERDEKEGANEREPKSSQVGAVWAYEKTSHGGWLVCWC